MTSTIEESPSNNDNDKKRLFKTIPIETEQISSILAKYWPDYKLGDRIKASQNHTFNAKKCGTEIEEGEEEGQNEKKVSAIVRVTPDPFNVEYNRIYDEITLVNYLVENKLHHVCGPIAHNIKNDNSKSNYGNLRDARCYIAHEEGLIIVLFEYAKGSAVNPFDWKWMSDETFARSWGRWTALLHNMTQSFAKEFPEIASRMKSWDQMHDNIMSGEVEGEKVAVTEEDLESVSNPKIFGICHGDLNISNFFYSEPEDFDLRESESSSSSTTRQNSKTMQFGTLSVFDWDQVQLSWFLYDLSSVVFFPYMLTQAETWMDGQLTPSQDVYEQWFEWVASGYEDGLQEAVKDVTTNKVNRDVFRRMVLLRRNFYVRFCRRALVEINEDIAMGKTDAETLQGMKVFMEWVVNALNNEQI